MKSWVESNVGVVRVVNATKESMQHHQMVRNGANENFYKREDEWGKMGGCHPPSLGETQDQGKMDFLG